MKKRIAQLSVIATVTAILGTLIMNSPLRLLGHRAEYTMGGVSPGDLLTSAHKLGQFQGYFDDGSWTYRRSDGSRSWVKPYFFVVKSVTGPHLNEGDRIVLTVGDGQSKTQSLFQGNATTLKTVDSDGLEEVVIDLDNDVLLRVLVGGGIIQTIALDSKR